jgi:hypothetical protein
VNHHLVALARGPRIQLMPQGRLREHDPRSVARRQAKIQTKRSATQDPKRSATQDRATVSAASGGRSGGAAPTSAPARRNRTQRSITLDA